MGRGSKKREEKGRGRGRINYKSDGKGRDFEGTKNRGGV